MRNTNRKRDDADREERQVQSDLPACGQIARARVGIQIPEEQQRLKEHQTGIPDSRGAAQQREHHACEEWLDPEKQKSAGECREREDRNQRIIPRVPSKR